jgi:transcriptional regulator with XRE-family HTH domain
VINIKNKALVKAVGERIREIRLKQGISQEALSHEADIPLSQIGRIERGETNPTISTLYVIAQALGTELTLLVDVQLKDA